MWHSRRLSSFIVASLAFFTVHVGGPLGAQTSTTNPYRATFGWENLPEGTRLGIVSGVIPDPDGQHLWILHRCGGNQCAGTEIDPILKFDLDGNLVESFGAGMFAFPHGFALNSLHKARVLFSLIQPGGGMLIGFAEAGDRTEEIDELLEQLPES